MFFRCEAIISLFQLMELATIQSTADFKASWHSLDERPQKKGVCEDSLISRTFKLLLEVDLSHALSLFQNHPQSTLKPQPSRSVLSWKKGGGVRAVCNWCHMIPQWQRDKGEGVKGQLTRSALAVPVLCSLSISPSLLTCQCSPSSKACLVHIEVPV